MRISRNATLAERFWPRVEPIPEERGCWEWIGNCHKPRTSYLEYGLLEFQGRSLLAHRASWLLHFGPIPDGLCVLHRCDNPRCVNPSHLFLGSRADNCYDMWGKGRGRPNELKAHCKNGHPIDGVVRRKSGPRSGAIQRRCNTCNREAARRFRAVHYCNKKGRNEESDRLRRAGVTSGDRI